MNLGYRILFLGSDWYGSSARACGYALRRAGHEVIDVSTDGWDPHGQKILTKILIRLVHPMLRSEFNAAILDAARRFSPDMMVAFKGCMVNRRTLQQLRRQGVPLYQYYPDNSLFAHADVDPGTMEEYDCCFFTKRFLAEDAARHLTLRGCVYLPHGYDPEIHCKPLLSEKDQSVYGSRVAVIAVQTPGKEAFLDRLLQTRTDLPLKIWGFGWKERCRSERVRKRKPWDRRSLVRVTLKRWRQPRSISLCSVRARMVLRSQTLPPREASRFPRVAGSCCTSGHRMCLSFIRRFGD